MTEQIERREYKYLTDEATAATLRGSLRPFCELDAYAAQQPTGRYNVDSLYFDTPKMALWEANNRELPDRFKLRVRTYPQTPDGPVFLEVKRRVTDVILKTRGQVPGELWPAVVRGERTALSTAITGANRAPVERFCALVQTYQARPVTLVRYEREAWVSQIDGYARVTIDRQVRSQQHDELSFAAHPTSWRAMDNAVFQDAHESMTIVELKFTSAVPRWMMHLVQHFDLMRSSFSKYSTSVRAWFFAPALRTPTRYGARAWTSSTSSSRTTPSR